ncbi:MAG: site-specific integrase [Methanothrix sp.]|nr:site-specific integrase [Methanothrix sp.]
MKKPGVAIRKKRDGVWGVFVSDNYRRKSVTFYDEDQAQKAADVFRAQLGDGTFWSLNAEPERACPIVRVYAEEWLRRYERGAFGTFKSYRAILRNHLVPAFGSKPLSEIKRRDIRAFTTAKLKSGLQAKTVMTIKKCVSAFFEAAVEDEWISANPAHFRLQSEERSGQKKPFTAEEWHRFEAVIKRDFPYYHALVATLFRTGMRISEALGLKVGDVNLDEGKIIIRRKVSNNREGKTKTETSARTVWIWFPDLIKVLREHEKTRATASDWYFPSRANGVANQKSYFIKYNKLMANTWRVALKRAGIPAKDHGPHAARHTFISQALQAGVDVWIVSKQVGHASSAITEKEYFSYIPKQSQFDLSFLEANQKAPTKHLSHGKLITIGDHIKKTSKG